MNHKTLVVKQAILGLKAGGLEFPEIWSPLLERIYDCGYNEAIRNLQNKQNSCYTDIISDGGMDPR